MENAKKRPISRSMDLRPRKKRDPLDLIEPGNLIYVDKYGQSLLEYGTGEQLHQSDLVVILRSEGELKDGRFDEDDVFDGPFRIKDTNRAVSASAPTEMGRKLVTVSLPEGSRANDVVEIERLRPVFDLKERFNGPLATLWSQYRETQSPAHVLSNVINKTISETRPRIVRVADNQFTLVQFKQGVALSGESQMRDVLKLRGIRLALKPCCEYPDEPQETPAIEQFKRDGGHVPEGYVLVTEYKVHRNGWTSADDTWIGGHGAIPSQFIEHWESANPMHGVHLSATNPTPTLSPKSYK